MFGGSTPRKSKERLLYAREDVEAGDRVNDARFAWQTDSPKRRTARRWWQLVLLLVSTVLGLVYLLRHRLNLVEKERLYEPILVSPFNASSLVDPFGATSDSPYAALQRRWQDEGFRIDTLDCSRDFVNSADMVDRARYERELLQRKDKIYIALNLYNNIDVLPSLARTIFALVDLFGPANVGVSIFENGSKDGTRRAIAHFAHALDAAGVRNSVLTDPVETDWDLVDRLVQLAYYRNIVLDAFLDDSYDTVLFMNDVFVCPNDVLELMYQRKVQNASATCGLDWIAKVEPFANGRAVFYDNWVTRSLTGRQIRPRFDPARRWINGVNQLFSDPGEERYRDAFRAGQPIPVYSCWNGMVAFDSRPFVGRSLSPGTEQTRPLRFRAGDKDSGECTASECQLVAKDMWRRGFDRFVMVPTVRATYDRSMYHDPQLVELASRRNVSEAAMESERIDWSSISAPDQVTCWRWKTRAHVDFWWLAEYESPV